MSTSVSAELVRAFLRARISCDRAKIAPWLDDDIEWSISGPIDVLCYAGYRRGKETVLEAIVEQGPKTFRIIDMVPEDIVVEGDKAITRVRLIGVQCSTGRSISYQSAQILRFRAGKLTYFRAITDSFDAAEQTLGREIDLSDGLRR